VAGQPVIRGDRLNFSHSAPVGLWWVTPFNAAAMERGQLVEVCPPDQPIIHRVAERGYLKQGSCADTHVAPLLKAIGAIPGDWISVEQGRAVSINGDTAPNSTALPTLPGWPDGIYNVPDEQVWLFSTYTSSSFDSRYFGPVNIANIRGGAQPVLVNGNVADMMRVSRRGQLSSVVRPHPTHTRP